VADAAGVHVEGFDVDEGFLHGGENLEVDHGPRRCSILRADGTNKKWAFKPGGHDSKESGSALPDDKPYRSESRTTPRAAMARFSLTRASC